MPQLTLTIDKKTFKRIEKAASLAKDTASGWVSDKIKHSMKEAWPDGYFNIFGSIKDPTFKEPEELSSFYFPTKSYPLMILRHIAMLKSEAGSRKKETLSDLTVC
jgi:hypothetical protein